ncbi:29752_t:CDS:1, partial [Gigaspora margarita]
LVITKLNNHVIEAHILTGDYAGNLTFIPRISLTSTHELPFQLKRYQFPIQLAFAITINKSQGQSVKYIGLDLRTPVFSHGQLYVALFCCTSPHFIKILLSPNSSNNSTLNIVYPEILLNN